MPLYTIAGNIILALLCVTNIALKIISPENIKAAYCVLPKIIKAIMKNYSLILILTVLFFSSCSKEDSYPSLPGGKKLVRSVATSEGGTTTTTYAYTSDGKLDAIATSGTSAGIPTDSYSRYYRDGAGRIIKIATKVPVSSGSDMDTVYKFVHYPDASTFNYDYTVQEFTIQGFGFTDSTVYTFNGSGQVTESYTYQKSGFFDDQEIKMVYTYDGAGNLSRLDGYNNASGPLQLSNTFEITYDDKTNPLSLDPQITLITGAAPGSSGNNPILVKFTDVNNPDAQTITNTYTYNADGLPETMVSGDLFDGVTTVTTTTFYYE